MAVQGVPGGLLWAALAALALLAVSVWWSRRSVRRARAQAAGVAGGRVRSLAGRTVVGAVVISGGQWVALAHPWSSAVVKAVALVVPALVSSWVLVRALTVTTVDDRRGRRR